MNGDNADRDRKALEIFTRASDLTNPEARAAFIEGACHQDPLLRQRVFELLAKDVNDSFLQLMATLKGHVQGVIAVAFSPDGKTLVTASHDRKVKLWNATTHQELLTFPFNVYVVAVRFTPDGRALAIGYVDERGMHIQLVQAPSFEEIGAAESGRPAKAQRRR